MCINKKRKGFHRTEGYSEDELLNLALTHFYSAQLLFTDPLGFFSGGFLIHLSVELVLKACCLFYFDEYPNTHLIKDLLRRLKEHIKIEPNTKDQEFIKRLDWLHHLRYKLDPIGSNDLDEANRLVLKIINQMPEEIQNIFKVESEKIKITCNKIPSRVFKDLARNHPASN